MSDDRIVLYALAAHAAGDFPFQTDWMAKHKLESPFARVVHVTVYTAAFVPVALASSWSRRQSAAFLATIAPTHFAIDSQRWNDNPIWFDQALHIITLAIAVALADRTGGDDDE